MNVFIHWRIGLEQPNRQSIGRFCFQSEPIDDWNSHLSQPLRSIKQQHVQLLRPVNPNHQF